MFDQQVKDLCLLLLYLTSWDDPSRKNPGEIYFRSWKGYPFEVLNTLEEEKMLKQSKSAKSVTITDAGKKTAEELKAKYFNK